MQNRESASSIPLRRAFIVGPDVAIAQELQRVLATQRPGVPCEHLKGYQSPREIGAAVRGSSPSLAFLDFSSEPDQALALLSEVTRLEPGVPIVAILGGNDPDLILRCLRSGAADFLLRPFTADQLDEALGKLARFQSTAEGAAQEAARVVSVMPAKGACGATTVACNLAFQWKRHSGARILLADLDPLAGTVSFLLKIKSVYSFQDALQRAHELDSDLWKAMVTNVNGVDVLLAPELTPENPAELRDPAPILDYARHSYDVIVLDAGSVYGEWNLNQARLSNELLLVTTNELPALQAAQRALSYLDANRIGRWKVRLIVNRYQRDVGLNRDVIGTALHTEVFDSLPSDYESVQKALLEGKPVPPGTALGKGFSQLAERLAGPAAAGPKKTGGGLSNLFGLFSKSPK